MASSMGMFFSRSWTHNQETCTKDYLAHISKSQNCNNLELPTYACHSRQQIFLFLFRKELTSRIVNTLIRNIDLIDCDDKKYLDFKEYKLVSEGLKKLLFKVINRKNSVQLYEKCGEKIRVVDLDSRFADLEGG